MSAETITTAIFLITAVVATAVLVNAIYPVISTTAGTFSSSTHDADTRLRTDFKIVAAFNTTEGYDIYLKNIGSQRISFNEIKDSEVFCGTTVGNRLTYTDPPLTLQDTWYAEIKSNAADDGFWDTGETLAIYTTRPYPPPAGQVYFQFILPNGIWRSTEFS
jgi:flagellar protein FlaG